MSFSAILVDIGNTSAHAVLARGGRLSGESRIPTAKLGGAQGIAWLRRAVRSAGVGADVVAASVVPSGTRALRRACAQLGARCLVAREDLPIPILNHYARPRQVGTDRLLNALAAHRRFRTDCVVIDFGTAITFDVVSARGVYEGGLIAPGIEISLDALAARTALLPRIRLRAPKGLIGRDTVDSIRAGCAYGIAGLCEGVLRRLRVEWKPRFKVLSTGGYARFMRGYCPELGPIDPLLVPKGLLISYREAKHLSQRG
ncbi:MAG: Type III pantothenate kinase [Candidatus Omnitrophica bacterium]|nr:Type III pantothenate kinase [Candidatus Omnitrophota bacterium]